MIAELVEQLLLAALIDHAARMVAAELAVHQALTPAPWERRHSYACNVFNGGMCSCW